ncbi:flagellar hook-associated protein FlgK [Geomesophilobacter sediminis]|uniref:Flagellar hook-associated protein 1 n=1 Tax=Geomesophilobacter sediminis TaxID=2798584 RepID=A0A8J7J731_9BACT|nr:flagellar hook-associated protein FlgK [Geomesophilobacter sediminis]MBJ6724826.1 flagellar hook-associated protein FlgK [Geomesophilobacter sediminis]
MSINSLLNTALSSLNAQNIAIEVSGENITNVNTDGYSRQTAVIETAPTSLESGFPLGSGVKVSTIQRSYDSFLQAQLMAANSTSGQGQTISDALQTVQPLFNDLTTDGLGKSLQSFFNSYQDLAANAQGVPEREAVLSNAQQLVDDFHRINTNLTDLKNNMNQSLIQITSNVNDDLNQIASLNSTIMQTEANGGTANEMRDQRELIMRQLSEQVGVKFSDNSDGTVSVSLPTGQALVTGKQAAQLSLQTNATTGYYNVMLTPPGGGGATDVTATIGGTNNSQGNIGGTLQVRDVVVNKYLSQLDELASTVANQVNAVQSTGYGLTSASTGINMFTPPAAVSGYSASIAVNITNTDDIAAANADPATGGTGNNNNAQSLAALYTKSLSMSTGTTTLGDFYNSVVGGIGVDVQSAQRSQTQAGQIVTQLNNQRESQSGVSLDEELVNLTKYQKAYQGAAKVINVGAEMFDTVLSLIQ